MANYDSKFTGNQVDEAVDTVLNNDCQIKWGNILAGAGYNISEQTDLVNYFVSKAGPGTITGLKTFSNDQMGIITLNNLVGEAAKIGYQTNGDTKGYIGVTTTGIPAFWSSTGIGRSVVTSSIEQSVGSASQPIYIDANGIAQAITSYSGKASTASTADKLGTATLGNVYTPIYLNGGTATKCSVLNMTSPSNLGYTTVVGQTLPTTNTLAFWNGRYNATSSRLQYCTNGEIVGTTGNQTITGTKTFSGTTWFNGDVNFSASKTVNLNGTTNAVTPATGDNSNKIATTAWVNTAVSQVIVEGVPTGTVIWFTKSYTQEGDVPTGYLICNGSAVNRTTYQKLFNIIGTKFGAGDGSTTFNLPKLTDNRFIEGSTTAGTTKNAGLPNITGVISGLSYDHSDAKNGMKGAFTWGSAKKNGAAEGSEDRYASFNANNGAKYWNSAASGVYGGSTTVQPKSLQLVPCIKYI